MISALIRGGRASLQDIGTHMEDDTDLESRIKKAKRWLTNKWTDVECHFIPYLLPILYSMAKRGELVLAIDGSGIGKDNMGLMLSLLWRKRAIPICWLVRQTSKGHFPEQMHVDLICQAAQLLEGLLEAPCHIILLGDGEFDGNELQKACLDQGWDYVLRTAKDTLLADNPDMENASKFGHLASADGQNSLFLPHMYLTKKAFGPVNALYWHDRPYEKPLFLLTSLECAPQAQAYYRKRYHIETFFGDLKSRGFHIHKTRIDDSDTLFNLLIVASLAFIISILFEFDARRSPHLSRFCRKQRSQSLSVFQIGLRGLKYYIRHGLYISFHFSNNFP